MEERKKSNKRYFLTAPDKTKKTKQLLGKSDLDIMLYKLKNYYDYIQIMEESKTKQIDDLNFQYDNYDKEVREIYDLGNIDCGNINKPFKVSILNSKTTKESKEQIQEK